MGTNLKEGYYERDNIKQTTKNITGITGNATGRIDKPGGSGALTVASLALYPENPSETEKMLDFLRGPRLLNGIDKQFIRDDFVEKSI